MLIKETIVSNYFNFLSFSDLRICLICFLSFSLKSKIKSDYPKKKYFCFRYPHPNLKVVPAFVRYSRMSHIHSFQSSSISSLCSSCYTLQSATLESSQIPPALFKYIPHREASVIHRTLGRS